MDEDARTLLNQLFDAGDAAEAGVRARRVSITAAGLKTYRDLRSLQRKEAFEATLRDAASQGAIDLTWDDVTQYGEITRVNLLDHQQLAEFLQRVPARRQWAAANDVLRAAVERYPVLAEVLADWAKLKRVRGIAVTEHQQWRDAIRAIEFCRETLVARGEDMSLRIASARLFNDSKRLEKLLAPIDVLLSGNLRQPARDERDIWPEIGLFREEQPIRLAGHVTIERTRALALLDAPYGAFPAESIVAVRSAVTGVLTIENLTTFLVEARLRSEEPMLTIFGAGTPSPAWRGMYVRLLRSLPKETSILHWGDVDEGGYRIAAMLARVCAEQGRVLQPWRMAPDEVPIDRRRPASPATVLRMAGYARDAGWPTIAQRIEQLKFHVEQEALQ